MSPWGRGEGSDRIHRDALVPYVDIASNLTLEKGEAQRRDCAWRENTPTGPVPVVFIGAKHGSVTAKE